MDVIHTVDGTYTNVNGMIIPRRNSKWYSALFSQYGVEDFAWAVACQSAQALQEFEDDKKEKELPWDRVLMRALDIGLCDTFIRTKCESKVTKKMSDEQHRVSVIGTHLWLRQERQYDMVRPPDLLMNIPSY